MEALIEELKRMSVEIHELKRNNMELHTKYTNAIDELTTERNKFNKFYSYIREDVVKNGINIDEMIGSVDESVINNVNLTNEDDVKQIELHTEVNEEEEKKKKKREYMKNYMRDKRNKK
jgi:hypothetical protein